MMKNPSVHTGKVKSPALCIDGSLQVGSLRLLVQEVLADETLLNLRCHNQAPPQGSNQVERCYLSGGKLTRPH